jgi:hypothetical protein
VPYTCTLENMIYFNFRAINFIWNLMAFHSNSQIMNSYKWHDTASQLLSNFFFSSSWVWCISYVSGFKNFKGRQFQNGSTDDEMLGFVFSFQYPYYFFQGKIRWSAWPTLNDFLSITLNMFGRWLDHPWVTSFHLNSWFDLKFPKLFVQYYGKHSNEIGQMEMILWIFGKI